MSGVTQNQETPAEKKARENMAKVQAKEKEKRFSNQQKEAKAILEKAQPAIISLESMLAKDGGPRGVTKVTGEQRTPQDST